MKAFVIVVTMLAATASATAAEKCADGKDGGYEIVRGADGKKIFKLKCGIVVKAKPPKPSVIYVLNASTINYEWENLKMDFLSKTLHSVEQTPF